MAAMTMCPNVNWDSLQMGGDGKLCLQMGGGNGKHQEEVTLELAGDGKKMQLVGKDGRVKGVWDIITPIDPEHDTTAKELAKFAANKNGLNYEKLVLGIKVNVLLGTLYVMVLTASKCGETHTYLTAVHKSFFNKTVLFFARVPFT